MAKISTIPCHARRISRSLRLHPPTLPAASRTTVHTRTTVLHRLSGLACCPLRRTRASRPTTPGQLARPRPSLCPRPDSLRHPAENPERPSRWTSSCSNPARASKATSPNSPSTPLLPPRKTPPQSVEAPMLPPTTSSSPSPPPLCLSVSSPKFQLHHVFAFLHLDSPTCILCFCLLVTPHEQLFSLRVFRVQAWLEGSYWVGRQAKKLHPRRGRYRLGYRQESRQLRRRQKKWVREGGARVQRGATTR